MTIRGLLLAGASICALGMGSAFAASAPHVGVMALRPGHLVAKTPMHRSGEAMETYTYAVSTGVSTSSSYKTKTNLLNTFYTLEDSFVSGLTPCIPAKKQKVKLSTKKTAYAKLSPGKATYSIGCTHPTVFYGTVYDLTTNGAAGAYDSFVETLSGHVEVHYVKYIFNMVLDVTVAIGS